MTQAEIATRKELRALGEEVRAGINGKYVHVHVGTWLDRPGCSIEVRLTSNPRGKRIVIHKWDDEATCSVTYNEGDFWRDPDNAHEYAKDPVVTYSASQIIATAQAMVVA